MSGKRLVSLPAAALALGSSGAQAAEDIDWLLAGYVWGAEITIDARDASVDIAFSDLVDKLEFGMQAHVEAQGDAWGGFADATYLAIGENDTRPIGRINTDVDTLIADVAAVWSPGEERLTGVELFGGLRYIANDIAIVVEPVVPGIPTFAGGDDSSFADALFGLRYIAPLAGGWRMTMSGDVSAGDTEGTWSLGIDAAYPRGPHVFIAGYRHMEIDLLSGGGEELTETLSGPLLAYGYRF
jgi:hypothetical protein